MFLCVVLVIHILISSVFFFGYYFKVDLLNILYKFWEKRTASEIVSLWKDLFKYFFTQFIRENALKFNNENIN